MDDADKTREQLISELTELRQKLSKLQTSETELRKTQESLQSIFRAAPTGIGLVANRIFLQVNDRFCDMVGYSRAELIGQSARMLYLTDEAYKYVGREKYAQIQAQETGTVETVWRRKDGQVIDILLSSTPLNPDNLSDGVTFTALDITRRKQTEKELANHRLHLEEMVKVRTTELEKANVQLQALSRVKDEFVANVSHELRTPITNLKLRHDLLNLCPDKLEEYLAVMQRETVRLEHIIESLLYLSRLDQDRVSWNPVYVDLNLLTKQFVADRMTYARSKELDLTFSSEQNLPLVEADQGLWEQVLSILLTNAFNYTPANGSVMVKTQLKTDNGRSWAGVSVADTGLGIQSADQQRLFERFFRGAAGRETGAPGTGLGLAIVQEIVNKHQGEIEFFSEGVPGKGTIFKVWLPVAE